MAVISIKSFGGIAPAVPARYLSDSQAQTALNCPVFRGSIQPLRALGDSLLTLPKTGTPKTIYRYGQDLVSDTQYWFHWDNDVDVCRSQIAGDTSEWTFYTGDGPPKATYAALALSGAAYPTESRPLGVPAPTTPVAAVASGASEETTTTVKATLTASDLSVLRSDYDLEISDTTDEDASFVAITLPAEITASSVAAAINGAPGLDVTATAVGQGVEVVKSTTSGGASVYMRVPTGETVDTSGTPTYVAPDYSAVGAADGLPTLPIPDFEVGSITSGDTIVVTTEAGEVFSAVAPGTMDAAALAAFITGNAAGKIVALEYGSAVNLGPGTEANTATGSITYARSVGGVEAYTDTSEGTEAAQRAGITVTLADLESVAGKYVEVTVNGSAAVVAMPDEVTINDAQRLAVPGVDVEIRNAVNPVALVTTEARGTQASLRIRGATYSGTPQYTKKGSTTLEDITAAAESRVYTYTWVAKEAGYDMESAPAPASASVDVYEGQDVDLSSFGSVPAGEYGVTHKRVYRSVSGVYLYVDEIPAAQGTYTDTSSAERLAEELPSLYWSPPPDDLAGLVNLPNGMMAGFVGRDVYFCEPYRPHAWPVTYMQTVDYPVVGLGRMDTTLAVLTTGVPYLMQGAHPDSITVVKSDLEQACVSKRSIVSFGGSVVYAAPDGLMLLSPGGSRIITEELFNYRQWQAYFKPESIHAYAHDNQYIAFYDNGVTQGGFVLDIPTRQFILHDIYTTSGFRDKQRDKLFLTLADKSLRVWDGGGPKNFVWRSKRFTMPQIMGFSCAQVEAEDYPMTLRVYADDTLIHAQTVAGRDPFRLPAKVGRDWELEVEGSYEVFAVNIANSMTELAGG